MLSQVEYFPIMQAHVAKWLWPLGPICLWHGAMLHDCVKAHVQHWSVDFSSTQSTWSIAYEDWRHFASPHAMHGVKSPLNIVFFVCFLNYCHMFLVHDLAIAHYVLWETWPWPLPWIFKINFFHQWQGFRNHHILRHMWHIPIKTQKGLISY